MLKECIFEQLHKAHYQNIGQMSNEVLYFCKQVDGAIRIIMLIDYHVDYVMTSEKFQFVKSHIVERIREKSKDIPKIDVFSLVLAEHFVGMKECVSDDFAHWIVDVNNARLLIYEDQPSQFFDLGEIIEESLQKELASKNKTNGKYFFCKGPLITWILVAVNIGIFLILEKLGDTESTKFLVQHGAMCSPYIILGKEYYRFVTSMFLHIGMEHLVNNMFMLFVIGTTLEPHLGKVKYLLLYVISGIGGNIVSFLYYNSVGEIVVSAGASGAIFGVIGALAAVVCVNKGKVENMTFRRLGFFIFLTLYYGFANTGVDNFAHVGGLCTGFVFTILLYSRKLLHMLILLGKRDTIGK